MKCRNCGKELKAEPAITEPGWVIFHECIFKGATEKEVIKNFAHEKEPTTYQLAQEYFREYGMSSDQRDQIKHFVRWAMGEL